MEEEKQACDIFADKVFVVSGGSVSDNRRVKQKIEDQGGTVSSRITKNTDYYIVGDSRRSDTFDHKATKYQVPRLNEKFLDDSIKEGRLIHDFTPYFNTTVVNTPPRKHKKRKADDENGYDSTPKSNISILTSDQEKELFTRITDLNRDHLVNLLLNLLEKHPEEKFEVLYAISTSTEDTTDHFP